MIKATDVMHYYVGSTIRFDYEGKELTAVLDFHTPIIGNDKWGNGYTLHISYCENIKLRLSRIEDMNDTQRQEYYRIVDSEGMIHAQSLDFLFKNSIDVFGLLDSGEAERIVYYLPTFVKPEVVAAPQVQEEKAPENTTCVVEFGSNDTPKSPAETLSDGPLWVGDGLVPLPVTEEKEPTPPRTLYLGTSVTHGPLHNVHATEVDGQPKDKKKQEVQSPPPQRPSSLTPEKIDGITSNFPRLKKKIQKEYDKASKPDPLKNNRPPANYSNKSPMGIADELKNDF